MKELLPFFVLMACQVPDKSTQTGVTATADNDGDGYSSTIDCDDMDPHIHPSVAELCDGIDNVCDGRIDEEQSEDALIWFRDADGDGFGDPDDSVTIGDLVAELCSNESISFSLIETDVRDEIVINHDVQGQLGGLLLRAA